MVNVRQSVSPVECVDFFQSFLTNWSPEDLVVFCCEHVLCAGFLSFEPDLDNTWSHRLGGRSNLHHKMQKSQIVSWCARAVCTSGGRGEFTCMAYFVKCLMSFTRHELCTMAELELKYINKNRPIKHVHTHTSGTCMCTCTHIMYGDADEVVAATGWRPMMDGRCLMAVLGGCSLPYIFAPNLSVCLTLPSSPLLRWWVMEGGSIPYQFFYSLPVEVSAPPPSPLRT